MSEFINTIDALGDAAVVDSIIDRSITEFKDDKLTTVGQYAFYRCGSLENINLPNATTVDQHAFYSCGSLEDINLPNATTLGYNSFNGCTSLIEISLPSLVDIHIGSENLFRGCTSLSSVDMPKVTSLTTAMFYGCNSLYKLRFPALKTIYGNVLNSSNVKTLILPNNVVCTLYNASSIAGCPIASGTGYVYVPSSLVDSYRSATNWSTYSNQFRGIFDDEDIQQGIIDETLVDLQNNEIESIPVRGFFKYTPIESVSSNSVQEVGSYAFYDCENLKTVNIPNCTSIGAEAFRNCNSIETLEFPNATWIGSSAFRECDSLTRVSLPMVTSIPPQQIYIFYMSTNLSEVDMPNVTVLTSNMFCRCSSLKKITLPAIETIAQNALENTGLEAFILPGDYLCTLATSSLTGTPIAKGAGYIYVPSNLVKSYRSATNWSTYANQFRGIFDDEDVLQGIADGTLTNLHSDNIDSIPIRGCYNYTPIESVNSTSATRVGENAFENCTSLESIDLPNVEYLDNSSFKGCVSLKKVVFPHTIQHLGEHAFSGCTSLEIADFWDVRFTHAAAYQFANCSSLKAYINRSTDFCEQAPHGYIFRNSTIPDINGEGYIYVPRNMIDLYIRYGWWGAAPDKKWRALENYTTDGTTTGEMREYTESVSLNVSELTFNDTNRQKLILTGQHGMFDEDIWESSNPSVASVYNGMVRPNSDGTAIITITSGNHSATCSVTVNIGQEFANILDGVIFSNGKLSNIDGAYSSSDNDVCINQLDISNYIGSEIEVQLLDVRSSSDNSRICFYNASNRLVSVLSGNKVDYGVVIAGVIPRDAVYAGISISKSSGFSGINIICEDATIGTTTYTP